MSLGGSGPKVGGLKFGVQGLPGPQRTYLFKDLYKEIIIRNPKKEGFIGLR